MINPAKSKKTSGLPDPVRAAKGLSLTKLWRSTPAYFKNKSRDDDVRLKAYKLTQTKGGMPAVVAKATSLAQRPPRSIHTCSIIGLDKEVPKLSAQKRVLVSCGCESYTFTWEYANWTWGASKILYSNGDPAVVKNPGNKPGVCIAKNALVTTEEGEKLIQDVKEGDSVLTLEGYRTVIAARKTGIKKTRKVVTSGGHSLRLTNEHKVLAFDTRFRWKKVKFLKSGDFVFQEKAKIQSTTFYQIDSEGFLAGLLIAEADESGYAPVEPMVKSLLEKHFKKVFGTSPAYTNAEAQHIQLSNIDEVSKKLGFVYTVSEKQRIPLEFQTRDLDFRRSLIYGLWMGDGHIAVEGSYASYGSTSLELARDVQNILRSCGVYSRIWENEESTLDPLYHVRVPPSSIGAFLSCIWKYKSTFEKYGNGSPTNGVENTLGIPLKAWARSVRKSVFKDLVPEDTGDTYHLIRGETTDTGKVLAYLIANHDQELLKVMLPGSFKPSYCAKKGLITYASLQVRRKTSLRMVPSCPDTSNLRLKEWLTSIKVPHAQLDILRSILRSGATAEKVEAVSWMGKSEVYDLEIEGAHHFLANGFVVHNCKHLVELIRTVMERKD